MICHHPLLAFMNDFAVRAGVQVLPTSDLFVFQPRQNLEENAQRRQFWCLEVMGHRCGPQQQNIWSESLQIAGRVWSVQNCVKKFERISIFFISDISLKKESSCLTGLMSQQLVCTQLRWCASKCSTLHSIFQQMIKLKSRIWFTSVIIWRSGDTFMIIVWMNR